VDEECTTKKTRKDGRGGNCALRENTNGEGGAFAQLYLTVNEQEYKTAEPHE